jgi:hypothetical protein
MHAKSVALIPRCAECEAHWRPADDDRWRAYLTDDEPPELAFLLPGVRGARVRRRLSSGPAPVFGYHIRAG